MKKGNKMSSYDNVIVTDVDGVLLNWGYAFDVWMNEQGYKKVTDEWKHYCVFKQYGIPEAEGKRMVNLFNQSAVVGFLPPLRDAIHYVRKLHEEHGYVFHVCTSLHKDKNAQKLRIMNLEKLFGETVFEKYIILGCGDDKDEALAPYKGTDFYWIEDKVENAIVGKEVAGLNSIVMEHGFNMNDPELEEHGIPLAKNWKDIYETIVGI